MVTKVIEVTERQKGWIIGRGGCTIRKIKEESGAVIDARVGRDRVKLVGDREQIHKAECMIQSILSGNDLKKDGLRVTVPSFTMGFIIGKNGNNLKNIEEETGTKICLDPNGKPNFYVKGTDPIQKYKAKLKIKEVASNCRRLQKFNSKDSRSFPFTKFPFIDDRHVGDDSEFILKLTDNPHPRWSGPHYDLDSVNEHQLQTEKDSADFNKLREQIKELLQYTKQHESSENLLVDMWCHYGHAYITRVDEGEVSDTYSLPQVIECLKREDEPWIASFIGGVHELDVHNFERELSHDQDVPPYIRYDLSFFSPSCRQIRVKVYLKVSGENGEELRCCDDNPVVVKNVLEKVSRDSGLVYYLCAPPVQHIKVHIFIPFVNLDCHFMMRTTFRNITRTPEEEEEDKILIDFLNENLKINSGKLELPTKQEQLPVDFDLAYWRKSKRRIYTHEGYKIKISEETSENVNGFKAGEDVKTRNDIHIHLKDWDEQFCRDEWQPDQIVEKIPDFLSFVREVQKYISAQESDQED